MNDKDRADALRLELKQTVAGGARRETVRGYLLERIDELDPQPKLPGDPKNGDVIDAVFSTDPAYPQRAVTVRLHFIGGAWVNQFGQSGLNFPAIVSYTKVL